MGANTAICSAAVLANMLHDALKTKPNGLSMQDIDKTFEEVTASRQATVQEVYTGAGATTRLEAQDGLVNHMMGRYLLPKLYGEGWKLEAISELMRQSPILTYLDKPNRPHEMPYYDEEEKKKASDAGWFSWLGF